MKRYLAYLKHVIRHKRFVLAEGRALKIPFITLLSHDLSKFRPDEFIPYARCYYTPKGHETFCPSVEFRVAQMKHIHRNPHHWEFWISIERNGETKAMPMPEKYIIEMVADWKAFTRTRGQSTDTFFYKNRENMRTHMHPDSFQFLDAKMREIGDYNTTRESALRSR